MLMWCWRGSATTEDVTTEVVHMLAERGYERSRTGHKSGVPTFVRIVCDGEGGALVASAGLVRGEEVASSLSKTFSIAGRYVEVDLEDADVTAVGHDVGDDGALGAAEDLDEQARETCEEWFEGKKYRSEALDDLVAIFVGLDDGMPTGGNELAFVPNAGARVQVLLEAVKHGATWEKTQVDGRDAVRVKDAAGTRVSVLEPDELTRFEASLPKR